MADRRVTLREASVLLGVSEGAIRKRVARGTIRSDVGQNGRRYVYLDEGTDKGADASSPHESDALRSGTELVDELRDRVHFLEEQLAQANERDRENRRLLAGLIERVPQLEAPRDPGETQEPAESLQTVEEEPDRAEPRSDAGGAQGTAQRRPWWRRIFGG